jgi:hypothetical protein
MRICFTHADLLPVVLEAIENLNLSAHSHALEESLRFATDSLSNAKSAQLPAIVKFLFGALTSFTAPMIVTEVRRKIGDYLASTRNNGLCTKLYVRHICLLTCSVSNLGR